MDPSAIQFLKRQIRKSSLAMAVGSRLRGIRVLRSLEELDDLLEAVHPKGGGEPDPLALRVLARARFQPPARFLKAGDPFSPEYRERQQELYRYVAGKAYAFENEATAFDPAEVRYDFFPYNTRSPEIVGLQLQSQGFLIRNLDLAPGSRVVEFGAGWGNTALNLALMGYDVTAVEMNEPSLDLMRHRAEIHRRQLRLAKQDMASYAAGTEERFDGAIFVASFHHCADHAALVKSLGRVLTEKGQVYFADEPISPSRTPILPYPWGLRLDAGSLYYVRRYGWLELGFQEAYFREMLGRAGWEARRIPSNVPIVEDLFEARRKLSRSE